VAEPLRVGQVYGQWPRLQLQPGPLCKGRDLALTTDFRAVFGEILSRHLGLRDLAPVFPAYPASPASFLRLLA